MYIYSIVLTDKEISRYSRHLLLPEISTEGQEKLKNARVLVVGAGGLGCPVLQYLAAAGIGSIGIIDFDKVDESNLQRQVLFAVSDIGKSKAVTAKEKLLQQNPLIRIDAFNSMLSVQNALELIVNYDIVVDGTDNFSTRYLINDACVLLNKTLVSGSIFKFEGQVSVFNHKGGPTYRCLFPAPPPPGSMPACSEVGVLGVLTGIIGTLMANEVIKIVAGIGEILSGKVLLFDALATNFQKISVNRNELAIKMSPQTTDEFRQKDYDLFCGIKNGPAEMKNVSAEELLMLLSSREPLQLLDVREPGEQPVVPVFNDLKIPLGLIEREASRIARDKKVIVICRSGVRSRKAIELLSAKFGYRNLYNLKGGVMAWLKASA